MSDINEPRPEIAAFLAEAAASGVPPVHELSPDEARTVMLDGIQRSGPLDDAAAAVGADDVTISGGIVVRVYRSGGGTRPAFLFMHGGGWVIGDLSTHDAACRRLAALTNSVVVAVDYRRAPEHPFPAAPADCLGALRWLIAQHEALGVDPARLSLVGDSAGGNLAAVVAQVAAHDGIAIASQALIYPVTDLTVDPADMPYGEGYFLTAADMAWFCDHYATPAQRLDPLASPLLADSLAGLAPAYIVTCELDPLRPQGLAYAERLRADGVQTCHDDIAGMIHGYATMNAVTPAATELWIAIADHATQHWGR